MKASTERKIMRWVHIILGIPIIGYLYGPVASIPTSAMIVRWVIFPLLVLSGLWLWKGHLVRKRLKRR
jgi:thiosulfate reductase cytochrome b subunit